MSKHTLYLCYFGLREPLVQTQVLPYLREIKKMNGLKVSLLTFEPDFKKKWTAEQIETEKKKLADENINWYCLSYHKRPTAPATVYDVFRGMLFIKKLMRREKIDILHARVHVPAMMGALAKFLSFGEKPKLLFDIRGFFPEEYTDAGVWKENGWLFKSVKRTEKWLFKMSDGFVVLTEKARDILFPESKEDGSDKLGRPVEVIPCCVDLSRFKEADEVSRKMIRQQLNIEDRFVIVYIGSFGGWYLTDEMLDFIGSARKQNPQTFALILTQRDKENILDKLKEKGLTDQDFYVDSVNHKQIPQFLSASDCAISFIKSCYSKQSSSPTKIAEYLASGIPIITNRGVGDVAEQIETDQVGIVIEDFSSESYTRALSEFGKIKDPSKTCRLSAKKRFDLEKVGGEKYRKIYTKLFNK